MYKAERPTTGSWSPFPPLWSSGHSGPAYE